MVLGTGLYTILLVSCTRPIQAHENDDGSAGNVGHGSVHLGRIGSGLRLGHAGLHQHAIQHLLLLGFSLFNRDVIFYVFVLSCFKARTERSI